MATPLPLKNSLLRPITYAHVIDVWDNVNQKIIITGDTFYALTNQKVGFWSQNDRAYFKSLIIKPNPTNTNYPRQYFCEFMVFFYRNNDVEFKMSKYPKNCLFQYNEKIINFR